MATLDIDFDWTRGHAYELAKVGKSEVIRQISKGRDRVRPLELAAALYLTFADLDGSPASCLGFARAWGLLTTTARFGAAEPIETWLREIKLMKRYVSMVGMVRTANSARVRLILTSLNVGLISGPPNAKGETDIKPALIMQPPTLLSAMLVQLAQSRAGGASLQTCEQCGKWFERGGPRGQSARRSISVFCSEACKNRHHYDERRRAGK
jgi:hypothetical protein